MLTTALEIAGIGLLAAFLIVMFGLAGVLAAAGGVALLAAYVLERR